MQSKFPVCGNGSSEVLLLFSFTLIVRFVDTLAETVQATAFSNAKFLIGCLVAVIIVMSTASWMSVVLVSECSWEVQGHCLILQMEELRHRESK